MKIIKGREIHVEIPPSLGYVLQSEFWYQMGHPATKGDWNSFVELEIYQSPGLLSLAVTRFLTGWVVFQQHILEF